MLYETQRCSARISMKRKNSSLPLIERARASSPVDTVKRDCERVSPVKCKVGVGRRCERAERPADFSLDDSLDGLRADDVAWHASRDLVKNVSRLLDGCGMGAAGAATGLSGADWVGTGVWMITIYRTE